VVGVARIGLSLRPASERLREVLRWGVLLGLSLLGLGAAAAYFIAGKISVPILALARGADEIRSGNLHPRIDVQRDDELGILAESFVRMAARLRETMAQLEALNRNLEAEVVRRTRQIQHAYEFTSVLNSPIDRTGTDPGRMDAADMNGMLDRALSALIEATGTRGGGVFLPAEDDPDLPLLPRAVCGVSAAELGPPPHRDQITVIGKGAPVEWRDRSAPRPVVEVVENRLLVPLIFRNQPLGALALMLRPDEHPDPSMVEFVRQAAAQLAIAVSNGRAYARVAQLAYQLTEKNLDLAAQRDQVKAQRDQLEQQAALLRAQRDQLEQQRDQLEQQSAQLKAQRNQLQEVNRLKSEFLASVSHELRTPLNAIMGYAELVNDGIYGEIPAEAQEALAGVLESSSNLLNLINQILDLARVEAGRMEMHVEEVDLHEVASAVVKQADGMCRDRPYRVRLVSPLRPKVHTDRAKVQQILTNLVANAVKFTAEGHVDVALSQEEGGDVSISVRDTGIGIRREHLSIIFEEFRQVDGSSTRRFGGTGLGLAIARRLAALLGGSISVESVYGVGSTFTLRLPSGPGARATAKMRALQTPAQGNNLDSAQAEAKL
jgi:signal transduction histidine kinase/HAMP domain-containing protein